LHALLLADEAKKQVLMEAEEEGKIKHMKETVAKLVELLKASVQNGQGSAAGAAGAGGRGKVNEWNEIRDYANAKLMSQENDMRRLQVIEFSKDENDAETENLMLEMLQSFTDHQNITEKKLTPAVKDLSKIVALIHSLESQGDGSSSSSLLRVGLGGKDKKDEIAQLKTLLATTEQRLHKTIEELDALKLVQSGGIEPGSNNSGDQSLRLMCEEMRSRLLENEEKIIVLMEEKQELINTMNSQSKENPSAAIIKQLEEERRVNQKKTLQILELQKYFGEERQRLSDATQREQVKAAELEEKLTASQLEQQRLQLAVVDVESRLQDEQNHTMLIKSEVLRLEQANQEITKNAHASQDETSKRVTQENETLVKTVSELKEKLTVAETARETAEATVKQLQSPATGSAKGTTTKKKPTAAGKKVDPKAGAAAATAAAVVEIEPQLKAAKEKEVSLNMQIMKLTSELTTVKKSKEAADLAIQNHQQVIKQREEYIKAMEDNIKVSKETYQALKNEMTTKTTDMDKVKVELSTVQATVVALNEQLTTKETGIH
jgi:hypothetical protein